MFCIDVDNVHYKVEFEHNIFPPDGVRQTTVCKIFRGDDDGKYGLAGYGLTIVHPDDQYCRDKGRKWALEYALEDMGWFGPMFKHLRTPFWKKYFAVRDAAKEETEKVYKIMDRTTGLFMTCSGRYPVFTERGHPYLSLQAAKSAIKTRRMYKRLRSYDIAIAEFELVPTGNKVEIEIVGKEEDEK